MVIAWPVSQKLKLTKFPWLTVSILLVNILITWLFLHEAALQTFNLDSFLQKMALKKSGPLFPGILTHHFLHVDIFHLLSNVIVLWVVGTHMEIRWGPKIYAGLYFAGILVSGWAYRVIPQVSSLPAIGASGAVSAILGAYMVRNARVPIRFGYWLINRVGTFELSAWIFVLIWISEESVRMFGAFRTDTLVAHSAHVGGFLCGAVAGLVIDKLNLARRWEEEALATEEGLGEKAEHAAQAFNTGRFREAFLEWQGIIRHDLHHPRALTGLLQVYQMCGREDESLRVAIAMIRSAIIHKDFRLAKESVAKWKERILEARLPVEDMMNFASSLESIELWEDAFLIYKLIMVTELESTIMGKALYAAGKIAKDRLSRHEEAVKYFSRMKEQPFYVEWGSLAEKELKAMGRERIPDAPTPVPQTPVLPPGVCPKCGYQNVQNAAYCNLCYEVLKRKTDKDAGRAIPQSSRLAALDKKEKGKSQEGFVKHFQFGREVTTKEQATELVKETSALFYVVGVIQMVAGMLSKSLIFWDGIVIFVLAFLLNKLKSRLVAVMLLGLSLVMFYSTFENLMGGKPGGRNIILALALIAACCRVLYATFRYHGGALRAEGEELFRV